MRADFAVIGNPIAHSLSPAIHESFAREVGISIQYEKILADCTHFESQVQAFFSAGGKGLNVTSPCKERAFLLAQQHTLRCQQSGVANTLWMQDGVLWADNTDGAGFMQDITRFVSLQGASLLFLGAGGAVRGLLPSLLEQGIVPAVASRKETTLLALQEAFPAILPFLWQEIPCSFDIVVHATSAMVKKEELQVPAILWKDKTFYYDLSYSKKEDTPFVSMAKAQGYFAQDGFGMLVLQAVESFYCWHGVKPNFRSFIGSKVLS